MNRPTKIITRLKQLTAAAIIAVVALPILVQCATIGTPEGGPKDTLPPVVLGVYPTEDGYASVRIKPHVDDLGLTWAKGTVPTPYGVIRARHEKDGAGKIISTIDAPAEVEIVRG